MNVSELLENLKQKDNTFFSLEYFPPRSDSGVVNLLKRVEHMSSLGPLFVNVTFNPRTKKLTPEICNNIQKYAGLHVIMHLSCSNVTRQDIKEALEFAKQNGIRNIMTIRGEFAKQANNTFAFEHTTEMIKFIIEEYGNYFCICVGGYPESWTGQGQDSIEYKQDLKYLKEKVDLGAKVIISQLFYDPQKFVKFVKDCRNLGITIPIIPGIMPIQNYKPFKRTVDFLKPNLTEKLINDLEPIKENDDAVKAYGVEYSLYIINELMKHKEELDLRVIHFYTMNLERSIRKIITKSKELEILHGFFGFGELDQNSKEIINDDKKQLPWTNAALHPTRGNELVRPIYWANRPKSYVDRTEDWDEYPNGRWGNISSPAFGEYSDLHFYGKSYGTKDARRIMWGERPQSFKEIFKTFSEYIDGKVKLLPWTESGLALETGIIKDRLISLNLNGFLTINSQPRFNGIKSDDKNFGWGGKDGYIYQKSFLEFFTNKNQFLVLQKLIEEKYPTLQYHAVNCNGKERYITPNLPAKTCAVTWGVFFGREIQQPTVANTDAFLVWKDEAFKLWIDAWASIYPDDSLSNEIIYHIRDEYLLVNIVDNDYINGDIFKLFDEPLLIESMKKSRIDENEWEQERNM